MRLAAGASRRTQAAKNATPAAVNQIFAESFSSGDGWSFEGCQGGGQAIGALAQA